MNQPAPEPRPASARAQDLGASAEDTTRDAEPSNAIEEADIALSARVTAHRKHPLMKALGAAAELADQPPLLMLTIGVLTAGLARRQPRVAAAGAQMLASFAIATAMKSVLKRSISRTRPHVLLDEGVYESGTGGPDEGPWQSFPSGHTAGSVAAARALARTIPEAALPAYGAAAAVAAIQLPTAHHYASDVVAGAAIGVAADAIAERAVRLVPKLLASLDGEA